MKNIFILLVATLFCTPVFAQTQDKQWGIGLGAGVYHNDGVDKFGFMPQFSIGRYINPSFDATFQTELGFLNEPDVDGSTDIANFSLNLKYKLNNGYIINESSGVKPYIYAGPTYLFDNHTEDIDVHAGVGSRFRISPSVDFFVEGGYIDGLELEGWGGKESHFKGTAGLVFSFREPKDSDGDGVWDRNDDCPDTPAGVAVDENGCPLDTDGDGIPDYKDECPNEAGPAAFNGCPDTDGDGIPDIKDECPEEAGLAKFNGCPDTDKDGVPDPKDECPDTPVGWKVDAKGCPVDTDGDGVVDAEDECPTVKGPASNNGCPVDTVPDAVENFTPVLFDTDKHFIRENEKVKLDTLISALKENNDYKLHIYGHADERASEAYNQELSEDRAASVASYFKENGISADRIVEVKGFGELRPAVPNTSPENMQKNRRVEIDFKK